MGGTKSCCFLNRIIKAGVFVKLFYREYGQGQPLIILHGIFGVSDNWVSFAHSIQNRYHVFIPDQRNHGHSPHDPTFNYYAMCADLAEFISQHNLNNPIILGHSMGGKVAMTFALENPEVPAALIVADISLRHYERRHRHLDMIDAMMAIDFDKITSRREVDQQLATTIRDKRVRQFAMKNLYRRPHGGGFAWRLNLEAINLNIDDVFRGIQSNALFEKPALFIRGAESDYVSYDDFDQIYRNFPNADIKTIENAGHWLHADQPEAFLKVFDEFVSAM
jgi:pimeloyl-ACP methyl ester carboxylesterase